MTESRLVITLDGPSGSGKSIVARAVAEKLGWSYLDTGAMYRTVTLAVLDAGLSVEPPDEEEVAALLDRIDIRLDEHGSTLLDGRKVAKAIREEKVTRAVSAVSALRTVRDRLKELQREFARKGPLVAEGRDMGSVVFPDSAFKFYLDADPEVRARRRARQLIRQEIGRESEEEIRLRQAERDRRDSKRAIAPLVVGPDVERVDTSRMTIEEVTAWIVKRVKERSGSGDRSATGEGTGGGSG